MVPSILNYTDMLQTPNGLAPRVNARTQIRVIADDFPAFVENNERLLKMNWWGYFRRRDGLDDIEARPMGMHLNVAASAICIRYL